MTSEGVDTMLTQSPVKLVTILAPNRSCRPVVQLPLSRIPVEYCTVSITAITAIAAIAAIRALEAVVCEICSGVGI
jgi:hypothetical protein